MVIVSSMNEPLRVCTAALNWVLHIFFCYSWIFTLCALLLILVFVITLFYLQLVTSRAIFCWHWRCLSCLTGYVHSGTWRRLRSWAVRCAQAAWSARTPAQETQAARLWRLSRWTRRHATSSLELSPSAPSDVPTLKLLVFTLELLSTCLGFWRG